MSELPPGRALRPGSFPRRNRIIAALAALTIVVEAPERSGALITSSTRSSSGATSARCPGPIDSPQSYGTNELIREGAHSSRRCDDALATRRTRRSGGSAPTQPELDGEPEARGLACRSSDRRYVD